MRIIAQLIERGGDAYWPILERLEAERDEHLSRQKRLKTYLAPQSHDVFTKSKPGASPSGSSSEY